MKINSPGLERNNVILYTTLVGGYYTYVLGWIEIMFDTHVEVHSRVMISKPSMGGSHRVGYAAIKAVVHPKYMKTPHKLIEDHPEYFV